MSMTLNPVNEAAFQKAVQSLETLNRAAVFHPTGTGKSCIAWKVVEAHPQTTFFWLVAGAQRLALRQAELTRYNGGTLPGNVRFCDCEKLAAATPEQWVRLGEQKPGCIVLDCYHELSAVCWAQSVQKLLRMCPQAKVLGLGVPNGAPVCAAAQELFADCIVSHMTVAEAMAAGTMPVPSAYAALLWPQEEELTTLRARIKNLCMPKGDTSLRVQYEELSWSLRQVENLTVLLPRLLSDTSGHYLVLFESAAYQEKLGTELEQLLRTVDPAVRFYAADHACFADSAAVETFLSDTAPGPKVLLCVNAPGVQQPLEGLAGVILVRQSSLMSTFKQMLCRALVAAGSRSVPVFDLVAQFEGLGNGRTLQRDCTEAMTRAGSKTPGFRQERPMQQTYRLYGKLRREMEARWEVLCQAAADASAKEGTLELPRSYTIHSGVPVGKWLELQRQVQAGQRPGRLTAEQAAKLEKLGIRWNHRLEAAWEKGFASAQKYRTEHGDLLVLVCAICFSVHILVIDHFTATCDGVKLSCLQFLFAGTWSTILALFFDTISLQVLLDCIWPLLYVGVFSCGVGYTLQILAQKDSNPTVVTILLSLESVFAVIAGAVVLHQQMTGREYLGCVLMFAAVVLAQIPMPQKKEAKAE